ncbi:hypothetical protein FE257_006650 [Aspergillus nanangensis]|uniref:Amidase domain-containing protein n=1 Tax=Aspergillus nanangensis TaxID=2582783 RepID=A0AAD4GZH4_ASPNN|nr:hypothetical protein FE257_006650 [Aspergillus nanangensis]
MGRFNHSSTQCSYPALINATADQLRDGLDKGCFTSVDLVNVYTSRIHEVNSTLHMVLEINPDALDIAKRLDREREGGNVRGPLHGLPVLVKDMIGTQDQMQTSAGSYALLNAKVPADATVVAKLREHGMVVLGKTSMSEWANMRSNISSGGWNPRGGSTYAAYYNEQDPSGSSSGSGVATDLGLALAALGTETDGSIISPSEKNNIVGIKPTVGLTSRYMVIPVSEHQDTIGPMARTVKDAAMLLQAIAGPDPKDNYTLSSPFGSQVPDYVAACRLSGLQGKRLGVPQNVLDTVSNASHPVVTRFKEALSILQGAGATIVPETNFTSWDEYQTSDLPPSVVAADFSIGLARYLSSLSTNPNNIHNLEELRHYTRQDPREEYPTRDTGLWDLMISFGLNNTSPLFWPIYQANLRLGGERGLLGALSQNHLDAVILPTMVASSFPAILGSPVVTVPLGAYPDGTPIVRNTFGDLTQVAPGIPFGIGFLGPKWSEEALIGMAYAFEQRTHVRETLDRHYPEPETELEDMRGV